MWYFFNFFVVGISLGTLLTLLLFVPLIVLNKNTEGGGTVFAILIPIVWIPAVIVSCVYSIYLTKTWLSTDLGFSYWFRGQGYVLLLSYGIFVLIFLLFASVTAAEFFKSKKPIPAGEKVERSHAHNFDDPESQQFIEYVVRGRTEAMSVMLANGFNINFLGRRGRTPLYVSIESGNKDSFLFLLEHGADPNLLNRGVAAGRAAVQSNDLFFLEKLLASGMSPDIKHSGVPLVIITLRESGKMDHYRMLIEAGADLNAKTVLSTGVTVATIPHVLIRTSEYGELKNFIEAGGDMMIKSGPNPTTALHDLKEEHERFSGDRTHPAYLKRQEIIDMVEGAAKK